MSWWDLWNTKASDYIYAPIPGNQTSTGLGQIPLAPKKGYIRIFLKTWRIDNIREGWTGFYGAVHGYISASRAGGGTVEVDAFTSPNQLQNADGKHANRIVAMNFPVFGPVPYIGGNLDVKIGLFSIKSADLSGPFIDVLTTMASAAGGGAYVAAAKPFIDPLKKGIESITNTAQDARLEIGLVQTFSSPTTGYFAVIRADASKIDKATLRVDKDEHLVDASGQPIKDYPYFVFSIEYLPQFDTWYDSPDLQQPYADLKAAVDSANPIPEVLNAAYNSFRRKVKLSPYLIPADTERVLAEVKNLILEVTGVEVSEAAPKPSLTIPRITGLIDTGVSNRFARFGLAEQIPGSHSARRLRPASADARAEKPLVAQPSKRAKMPPLKSIKIYAAASKARS